MTVSSEFDSDTLPLFQAKSDEERPETVAQLTRKIKDLIDSDSNLQNVSVIGELSNFKHHLGKHMYFSLKDEEAQITCVFFSPENRKIDFTPSDGMEVIANGNVTVYSQRGNYQLYVRSMTKSGSGILWKKFEELKKKLIAEGLTSQERKRALPAFPRRIGVVASKESAGLQDILNVLSRRFPLATVILESVAVEGESSASSIAAGLERMAKYGDVDVVIVGRGGGSIESLWGFNTEIVARSISAMPVPIISAVGHETDTTIADLVADRRAATPTEAAELATPSVEDIKAALTKLSFRLAERSGKIVRSAFERCSMLGRTLRSPDSTLKLRIEKTDRIRESIDALISGRIDSVKSRMDSLMNRIELSSPLHKIAERSSKTDSLKVRLKHSIRLFQDSKNQKLKLLGARLAGVNPDSILRRGYSVVMKNGKAVKNGAELGIQDKVFVKFHKGFAECEVIESGEEVKR